MWLSKDVALSHIVCSLQQNCKMALMIPSNGLNLMSLQGWQAGMMSFRTYFVLWMRLWNIFSCAMERLVSRFFIPNKCLNLVTLTSFFELQQILWINFCWTISSFEIRVVWLVEFQSVFQTVCMLQNWSYVSITACKFGLSINFYKISLEEQASIISFGSNDSNMVFS